MTRRFNERILASAKSRKSRLVLALDPSGPLDTRLRRASEVLEATMDGLAAVKLNHHLLLPFGLEGLKGIIATCRSQGLPLIADLKINDIGATNLNIVDSLTSYGVDAVTANPFVGYKDGLGGVVERLHSKGGGLLLLVYMSHEGAEEGYGLRIQGGETLHEVFARRAKEWGADGAVVSARSSEIIDATKRIVGKDCLIYAPGVGAQGGRVATAAQADFLIVGRAIVESPDPARALLSFGSSPER